MDLLRLLPNPFQQFQRRGMKTQKFQYGGGFLDVRVLPLLLLLLLLVVVVPPLPRLPQLVPTVVQRVAAGYRLPSPPCSTLLCLGE